MALLGISPVSFIHKIVSSVALHVGHIWEVGTIRELMCYFHQLIFNAFDIVLKWECSELDLR